jgi:hypothetical protein
MAGTGDGDDETHDGTTVMYFLDVLTSGLGAAILLFIVFSVLPHFGDSGAKSATGAEDPAAGPPVGAAADPLEAMARQTTVTFAATVVQTSPVAPKSGRWVGVPPARPGVVREAEEFLDDRPGERLFLITSQKGVSPDAKVRFELLNPPAGDFDVVVRVSVGGLPQARTLHFKHGPSSQWTVDFVPPGGKPVTVRRSAEEPLPVVAINFRNRQPPRAGERAGAYDWILLPGPTR